MITASGSTTGSKKTLARAALSAKAADKEHKMPQSVSEDAEE
jgi:hypothetical protein